ncbi:hypothetical protein [Brevibacterium linens]|uniref:Uncharacterized protein n=1 Tax=Brevibacterium linens ATCC 9172 TaxID=1255617 RepID=A0A2H1K864_BRELN|nr:hypothetical protein [Brevibacterium linens]KAB1946305.1 hypothetical protein F8227_13045 [Brevibacterium linens ATCC 9172]SMX95940.1 hypothetical protein BLIN9172_02915 [Brevibacterium linens ATCC 9172]
MNSVSDRKNRPNAFADRIAGFDDPSMGDERERDIILRAYTFGAVVSTYVFFALALVFAVLGAGMWSVLIVLGSIVTSGVISGYCKRENVDFSMAMARVSPRRLIVGNIVGAVFAIVWVGAIVFHMSEGYPLIDVEMGNQTMPGAPPSTYSIAIGAAFGFIIALTLMTISRVRKIKQARAEAAAAAYIEDED